MNPTLHRTNLNLHASDVAFLQHIYGYGWTEQARELLHQRVEQIKRERAAVAEAVGAAQTAPKDIP